MRVFALKLLILLLALTALTLEARSSAAADEFQLNLPLGIPADLWNYSVPRNNPLTPAKVELGRQLFFDQRLSADASISCATCHNPKFAFSDGKQTSAGIHGRPGTRNSPTILNAMFSSTMF